MKKTAIVLLACMLLMGACAAETEDVAFTYFSYDHRGTSTDEIYGYCLRAGEDGFTAELEFHVGQQVYTLPALEADYMALEQIITEHDLLSWNGFSGSDPFMMDGEGFGLYIILTDDIHIAASGSNCWPDGFDEAEQAIEKVFGQILARNEIDPEADWMED